MAAFPLSFQFSGAKKITKFALNVQILLMFISGTTNLG